MPIFLQRARAEVLSLSTMASCNSLIYASSSVSTLLSTFEECPFMGEQILYSKRRGFYKYNPDDDYPPEAFIGYCHWFSGIPLEEENDYELMRTIFYGERLQSDQHNEIDDVFGELCDFSSPDDSGGTPE